jgi:serine phosphatase RsbU (regulator of sigma subunit)
LELSDQEVIIGRLSDSEVVVTNPYVSRQHAKIRKSSDGYQIIDMKSTHGTFINGKRIAQHSLHNGDRITLGREQVEIQFLTGEPTPASFSLPASDSDLDKSMAQLTSMIPLATTESSNLEKISHILDFQYNWGKSFSAENTFRQILEAALKLSGAERGYVLLKEKASFKYVLGMDGDNKLLAEDEFPASRSVVKKVEEGGESVLMTENIDQAFALQQSILAMNLRAIACMPLKWITNESDSTEEVRGILYLDSRKTMHALSGLDQKILNKLALEAANVFEKLELIEAFEQRKAIEKELALARETQKALLPSQLPEIEGYELAAFSNPTRQVGGDFYDFLNVDSGSITAVLADVSGKGVSAALLSSLVQGALQMECRSGTPLNESLRAVNSYLCEKSQSNRFVTMFIFRSDSNGRGEFLSAGHNPAYLFRAATGEIEELQAQGLVLGAFGFAQYESSPLELNPGDLMVVYSDGITEAENPEEEMFGEERFIALIKQHASLGAKKLQQKTLEAVEQFTRGHAQTDDMTCVLVQRL